MKRLRPGWTRAALAATVVALLGTVFALYLQPGLAVALATRLWACF